MIINIALMIAYSRVEVFQGMQVAEDARPLRRGPSQEV